MKTHRAVMAVFGPSGLRRFTSAAFLLILSPTPIFAQQTAEELFQAGLYQEEVQGNLNRAIGLFEQILEEFPGNRPVAAKALMHIGLCHEKLGSREAQRAYQRLIRDFADQIAMADQARVRLASLQGLARASAPAEEPSVSGIIVRHISGGTPGEDDEWSGSPSPDGRQVAYVDWGAMGTNIGVRNLATGESRLITDDPGYLEGMALGASFSPDGETIAYWWLNAEEEGHVRLAFADGSAPRTLCGEAGSFYWPGPWGRGGERLVVNRALGDSIVETGWVWVNDGEFRVFERGPNRAGDLPAREGGALSPDDRYLAFAHPVEEDSERMDISMVSTDGGPRIPIVRHPANDRVVGWVPGTMDFLFTSDRGGKIDLYAVEISDGEVRGPPRIVRRDVGNMGSAEFTEDGDLFYSIYTLRMFVTVAPFDPETGSVNVETARQLLGPKAHPSWSPDGERLTYWHKRDRPTSAGHWDQVLGVTDLGTGEESELAKDLEVEEPRWALDGQSIMVVALERDLREGDSPAFFSIDPESGEASELLRFSPDSEWYWDIGVAQAPNGRDVVYVRDGRLVLHEVGSREKTELYRHPGLVPEILAPANDGRSLLFAVADTTDLKKSFDMAVDLEGVKGKLMLVRLPQGTVAELLAVDLDPEVEIQSVDWGPNGEHVYFTETRRGESTDLKRVPVQGGEVEQVWHFPEPIARFDISPAGQHIAYNRGENKMDMYQMENLRAALREMRENR